MKIHLSRELTILFAMLAIVTLSSAADAILGHEEDFVEDSSSYTDPVVSQSYPTSLLPTFTKKTSLVPTVKLSKTVSKSPTVTPIAKGDGKDDHYSGFAEGAYAVGAGDVNYRQLRRFGADGELLVVGEGYRHGSCSGGFDDGTTKSCKTSKKSGSSASGSGGRRGRQ